MALWSFFSYWMLPVFSSLVWFGMLLGMLLHWVIDTNTRHYPEMSEHAHIAYISNVGAHELKPLFIAGSTVTAVFLDLSFVAERWLRHNGRLVPNTSIGEKILASLTILCALIGTLGLILLTILDTWRHHHLHGGFLVVFIVGYLLSAVFICWEYQRLGIKNRQHRVLRASFWVKLTFVIVEVALVIVFIANSARHEPNVAAVFEWIVAFIFTFYILSFVIDLYPAIRTKEYSSRFEKPGDVEEAATPAPAGSGPTLHQGEYPVVDRNAANF
ncbi:hypothetical protein CDD83_1879 [Cordyceps sp. RAO-2017]|nr:hypothetical protein CDD83_1879 [Cordyceps sp. RAO-2017]